MIRLFADTFFFFAFLGLNGRPDKAQGF